MGLFHVYVEAPDRSPETIERLADTIGTRYGVPVAELAKRLAAGRFRVKANIDRVTADAYAKALADSGAVVKIEDALPTQPVPVIPPVAPPTRPRPSSSTLPPADAERSAGYSMQPAKERAAATSVPPPNQPATPSLPPTNGDRPGLPRPSTPPPRPSASSLAPSSASRASSAALPMASGSAKSGPVVATGLSAAYSDSAATTDLGALGGDSLAMVSLEGDDEPRSASDGDMFAPMMDLSPPMSRPSDSAVKLKTSRLKDEPMDLFAPPDAAEDAAFKVEIAVDDAADRARKINTPPAGVPVTAPVAAVTPPLKKKHPTAPAGHPVTVSPDAQEIPRWRFAAGVILSILLGFIPAHLIASARERTAFDKIDAQIIATQDQADSAEMYATLDDFRDAQRALKQGEKRNIALLSMLIWGVTAGGLAYVWFRRVPWNRLGPNA